VTFQPLETERLLLRTFEPRDWQALFAYTSDRAVMTHIPEPGATEDDARAFVDANSGGTARAVAVVLKSEDRLIGHMPFHPWFTPGVYEIGWVLHGDYQGRGYATEGALALRDHAFGALNMHRVIATCQPENRASWRVMEKLGMRREAHFRQCIPLPDGSWWDEYFYAILRDEWAALGAATAGRKP
jgi:RimJ/RimL family protein N-acetyltransferase